MQQRERNPWRILALAIAIGVPALLVIGAVVGMVEDAIEPEQEASQLALAEVPPAQDVVECNRYASLADLGEERSDAPAGETAAGDGAAQRPRSAAPDEGVGTVLGMSEENSRAAVTRAAYRDCMARKGFTS